MIKLYEEYEELPEIPENLKDRIDINNFVSNDDGTFTYNGNIDINEHNLTELPNLKITQVNGHFTCSRNELKSLKYVPEIIKYNFNCSQNELKSLEYAPKIVGGFNCSWNKLTSLKYMPKVIKGNFYCSYNKIKTLKYISVKNIKSFYCNNNQLVSLEYAPEIVKGNFYCNNNQLISLNYAPEIIGGTISCHTNLLLSIKHNVNDYISFYYNKKDSIVQPLKKITPQVFDVINKMTDRQIGEHLEFFREKDGRAYNLMQEVLDELNINYANPKDIDPLGMF